VCGGGGGVVCGGGGGGESVCVRVCVTIMRRLLSSSLRKISGCVCWCVCVCD